MTTSPNLGELNRLLFDPVPGPTGLAHRIGEGEQVVVTRTDLDEVGGEPDDFPSSWCGQTFRVVAAQVVRVRLGEPSERSEDSGGVGIHVRQSGNSATGAGRSRALPDGSHASRLPRAMNGLDRTRIVTRITPIPAAGITMAAMTTVPAPSEPARPTRRRDRRGRGPRGPLLPAGLPAFRTRAERFDDLVLEAVARLEKRWARQLDGTEFAVEDVPPSNPAPWEQGGVPLGRYFPADTGLTARIVIYRRPVETRALDAADLEDLVRDVVVEQVAHLLARSPDEVDPFYRDGH